MESIKVLTYNLCWGCMVADKTSKFDGSAQPLATTCESLRTKNNKMHVCLQNVATFIDNTCKGYDFIGTQENSNWVELNKASSVLNGMGYVAHLTNNGTVNFVTYYNKDKYTLLGGKAGDLIIDSSTEQGRPYQILILVNKTTKQNVILINVHNSHESGRKLIFHNFKDLTYGFLASGRDVIDLQSEYGNDKLSQIINNKEFIAIMTGDHNDHNKKESNFWKGIKPFKESNYTNLKDINLSTKSHEPPKTCCDTNRKKNNLDFRYSDYILISDNLEFITPNKIPDINYDSSTYPTSDHLPVIAEIIHNPEQPGKKPNASFKKPSKPLPKQPTPLVKQYGVDNLNFINFINYTTYT